MNTFRNRPLDDETLRVRIVLAVMMLFLGVLGGRLWWLQVARGHTFESDQTKQSIRRVRIPGARGRLFDRNGVCLADNRASYCIAVYLEELRRPGAWSRTIDRVQEIVAKVAAVVGREAPITREDIQAHIRRRLPLPFVVWRDVDEATLAKFAEHASDIPGVDIYTEAVRFYPLHDLAPHVIGYVGRADISQEESDEPYHYYLPDMAGRAGVERTMDTALRGEAGGRLVRIDVSGFRRHDVGQREPKAGADVKLALDARVQRIVEDALGAEPGAAVVVDPNNGDVLALASSPGYDLNAFIPAITQEAWDALRADARKPLIDRAISGGYPPGSTFKLVTAMAALENNDLTPADSFDCPGYFRLGSAVFRCWDHAGHGSMVMREALEQSCDVYFYHAGLATGPDPIARLAEQLGLGRKSEIQLDGERGGLVPDERWKKLMQGDAWRDGDTCNFAIGQGALVTTPLQMAMLTAAFANGGVIYRPRLVIGVRAADRDDYTEEPPVVANRVAWSAAHLKVVREGMWAVVMGDHGSGRGAALSGVAVAGKTGTAEFGIKEEHRRHTWMVAYAPYDAPKYAIALVVDEGISGGETAAPRIRKILSGLFRPEPAGEGQG